MNTDFKEVKDFGEIIYCKAEGIYTRIIFQKKSILTTKVLRCFESILPMDRFLRIHKSYIVNVDFISGLSQHNFIRLKTREELPVARRRRSSIIRKLSKKHLIIRSS